MPAEGLDRQQLVQQLGRLDSLRDGRLPAGEYTDDTEMTIGVAEALVEHGAFELNAVAETLAHNFTPWRGYSPHVYGIMARIRQGLPWDNTGANSWGSGAAVRVAPVAVLYADDPALAEHAAKQAEITHTHPNGMAGAVTQAIAVSECVVNGLYESRLDTPELLDRLRRPVGEVSVAMADALERLGDLRTQEVDGLSDTLSRVFPCDDTAVGSVPAALCAFLLTSSFEDAVIAAVNCGGQTDTLGALTGALAGAFYGFRAIPERLLAGLANESRGRDHVTKLGRKLGELTRKRSGERLEG
jgi:poly(ADP-ribose) glycohydrolase ARH3